MVAVPVLLLLVGGVLSAPYYPEFDATETISKAVECNDGEFGLDRTGASIFDYEGETQNAIVGASSGSTGMKMTARVHILPTENCMFSMQISESKLLMKSKNTPDFVQADESRKFSRELQAQELYFSVSEGTIKDLFPAVKEKTHILNIKRGILSTLQLGNRKSDEKQVDVNGICDVKFEESDGVIVKTKKLSECEERRHTELGIQAASFQQSNLPISPLTSDSKCIYKVANGKISYVECRETHLFRPFSAGYESTSGATTTVMQTMSRVEMQHGVMAQSVFDYTAGVSLLYTFEHEEMRPASSIVDRIDRVMNVLVDKSDKLNLAVKQNFAHEFTQLVTLFRQLDRKRMMPVWEKYFDCSRSRVCGPDDYDLRDIYRQYLLDALTYCGTTTCVYVVHNVIVEEGVTGEKVNMFLQGITLVAKPEKAMIRDVLSIATRRPSRQAFLTLGTLLNRFCSANPEECLYGKTNPVTQAELFLEGKLGKECEGQENWERAEEVFRTIKAIGNAGRPMHVWSILARCARMSIHQNISIAALDAMRHMPCDEERLQELYEMLSNIEMDPERRIHVFLAIMRCPSKTNLQRVVEQLEIEPSRQVGSFMWSHLSNLNESSDPTQVELRKNLREILAGKPLKKFDLEKLKYSRSWEGSLYSKMLKSGLKSEAQVIFHPESYLPRSALMNFTAHVMGVPLNVLEMAIRVEGLETILEDVFGPHGVMPDNTILKLFNVTITKEDLEKAERSRMRRDIENKVEDNVADIHARVNKRRIQPSGALSIKMFGHDIRLFSYDDIFWMIDQVDNMNVIELLLNMAKGGHKTFTKSFIFLEMTQSVPTGLGLPLKLKLAGSAVASLELDGKFDIRNMFWGPSQMELKGFVRPSAVAEISGEMGVDSHFIRSGMFINSSVFTSQIVKGGVLYKEGKIFKINIDAPEKPVELFNISTTPYLYFNEDIELVKGAPRRISPEFCMNSTVVLGLGLCTSFAAPVAFREYESPYFPMSGPAHFGVKIVKADPKLTTYEMMVKFEKVDYVANKKREYIGTFEMGTPGATYSRRVSGMVKYEETPNSKTLIVGTAEGHKKVEFMTSYCNDTNRFEVDMRSNLFTKEMVAAKFLYFNDSIYVTRHIGILASAHYGDLKVQQVVKFVTSPSSYRLHSRTTYYPGKHLTGEIEFVPADKSVNIRLDSNQFNETVALMGKIVNTAEAKGLNFTAVHYKSMTTGTIFAGFVSGEDAKKLVLNGTFRGKSAEVELGYFKYDDGYELRMAAEAVGKKIEIFTNYSTYETDDTKDKICEVLVGGRYAGKVAGGRVYYQRSADGNNKDLCSTIYINHEEPVSACVSMESDASDAEGAYKRVSLSGQVVGKRVAVDFEYERDYDLYAFNTTLLYNDKSIARTSWTLLYNGVFDTELKLVTNVRKHNATIRMYSASEEDATVFGIEGKGFNKTVALTATYRTEEKRNIRTCAVLFEVTVNKKLPVSYEIRIASGDRTKGISSILKIMKYTLTSLTKWERPSEDKYSLVWDSALMRGDAVVLGFKDTGLLTLSPGYKSFKQQWMLAIMGKEFEYGWNIDYRNLGREGLAKHEVQFGLQYGRGKKMSLTSHVINSVQKAALLVKFNFLKNREVNHGITYMKGERRLNIDIEFLPKMFVRLMARLDKVEGWKLDTQLKFDWKRMDRMFQWIAAYTNVKDMKGLSFQFNAYGQEFKIESNYNAKTKTAALCATTMGKTFRLEGVVNEKRGALTLAVKTFSGDAEKTWIQVVTLLKNQEGSLEVITSRSLVKLVARLGKEEKTASFSVFGLGKPLVSFTGKVEKKMPTLSFKISVAGKDRFEVVARVNRAQRIAFLYFDLMRKNWNLGFAAKYNALSRSITLSIEALESIVGVILRADCIKHIIGVDVFYNDNVAGWYAYLDPSKKALISNVTLSPRLSFQTVVEVVDDRILKFTTQRKIGEMVVNETTFKYELSMHESRLIFQWNTDTINSIRDIVVPFVQSGVRNLTALSEKLLILTKMYAEKSKLNSKEFYGKASSMLIKWSEDVNKKYNDIDFDLVKNYAREMVSETRKHFEKVSKATIAYAKNFATNMRERAPEYVEQAQKLKELAKVVAELLSKVSKNLTESAKPVAKTALKLAKEFKIRGKPLGEAVEELVAMLQEHIERLNTMLKKELSVRIPVLVKTVKQMKVPYLEKTVEEVYQKLKSDMKKATFDYDAKKTALWIARELRQLKVYGNTFEEHLKIMRMEAKRLPEKVRATILSTLEASKEYRELVKDAADEVKIFLTPLINLMKNVNASVYKHYRPLVVKVLNRLEGRLTSLYKPYEAMIYKCLDRVSGFTLPLVKPVGFMLKDYKQQIQDLRLMEKEIVIKVEKYLRDLSARAWEKVKQLNDSAMKTVERASKMVAKVSQASTEDAVEMTYEIVGVLAQDAIQKIRKNYEDREMLVKLIAKNAKEYYDQSARFYKQVLDYSLNEFIEEMMVKYADLSLLVSDEASKLVNQLTRLDWKNPMLKVWKEADLINHLANYGVSGRIAALVLRAKDGNMTEVVFTTVEKMRQVLLALYSRAAGKALKYSDTANYIMEYVKSIPKKEFDDFVTEVEEYAKEGVKKLVNSAVKRYHVTYDQAQKGLEVAKSFYENYYIKYIVPVTETYDILKERTIFIYEDNKDEAKQVYDHYKGIATTLIAKKYSKAKEELMKRYSVLYARLEKLVEIYGDMTWEEIGMKAHGKALKVYGKVYAWAEKEIKRMEKVSRKIEKQFNKLQIEAKEIVRKYKTKVEEEILPKMWALYKKYAMFVGAHVEKMDRLARKYYTEVMTKADLLYQQNKQKTIEQIYNELADISMAKYNELAETAKAKYRIHSSKLQKEIKMYYGRVVIVVKDILLPELKKEMESVFNQTLRATVVLANTTVDCFYPHYNLIMLKLVEAVEQARETAPVLLTRSKEQVEKKWKETEKYIQDLVEKIQEHPQVIKYQEQIKNHEYFEKSKKKYAELKPKVDAKYRELVMLINELLNNERFLRLKTQIKNYMNSPEVDQLIATLRKVKESLTFTSEQLKPKIESLVQDLKETLKSMSTAALKKAVFFRQDPEECFWTCYRDLVEMTRAAKNYDFREQYEETKSNLLGLAFEVTDLQTKEAFFDLFEKVMDKYEEAKRIPQLVVDKYKQWVDKYRQVVIPKIRAAMVDSKERVLESVKGSWALAKDSWSRCQYAPIFEHEIWSEIVDDLITHELVTETVKLARVAEVLIQEAALKTADYGRKLAKYMVAELKVKRDMCREKMIALYGKAIAQYQKMALVARNAIRKFLKEMTIEEMVSLVQEGIKKTCMGISERKAVVETIAKEWYAKAHIKAREQISKAKEISEKYYQQVESVWRKYEPKVRLELERMRELYHAYKLEATQKFNEGKTKFLEKRQEFMDKSMKLWADCGIVKKFDNFKRMTVRETVKEIRNELKRIPKIMSKAVSIYRAEAAKVIDEYKARAERAVMFMKPYIKIVTGPLCWIGNEMNETLVFVYRYYRLDKKACNIREFVVSKTKELVPKVPELILENLKKAEIATLKAVHQSLVNIDNVDVESAKAVLKSYVKKLPKLPQMPKIPTLPELKELVKMPTLPEMPELPELPKMSEIQDYMRKYTKYFKYIIIKPSEGKIIIRIPHSIPVQPSFTYQINRVTDVVKQAADKTIETARKLVDDVKNRTTEVRRDLWNSYNVHKEMAIKGWELANVYGTRLSNQAVVYGSKFVNESREKGEEIINEIRRFSDRAYYTAEVAAFDVYESKDLATAMEKVKNYSKQVYKSLKHVVRKMMRKLTKKTWKLYRKLQMQYGSSSFDIKVYQQYVKDAVMDFIKGQRFSETLENLKTQIRKHYRRVVIQSARKMEEILRTIEKQTPGLRKLIGEYKAVHSEMFRRYFGRMHENLKLAKVGMDRAVRVIKNNARERSQKPLVAPLKKTAMIFGKSHVMTFDRKFYEFPTYNKKSCTYLLARDFQNGTFTILSQAEHIIIITPDMKVDIGNDAVKSRITVDENNFRDVVGLPVQSASGKCMRYGAFVKCSFDQGLDVACDMEHFDCTINLAGWHYGKTEGVLGTNNNEIYDDLKMPGGALADTISEFVDAWEVSGDSSCLKEKEDHVISCDQLPSDKCGLAFGNQSPFAKFFSTVDPEPFLKACEIDTAVCDKSVDMATAHCNATASYVNLLKSDGFMVQYLPECASFNVAGNTVTKGAKWTQAPRKAADIVLLVSERRSTTSTKKTMASIVEILNKYLVKSGFSTRFAMVGFGGAKSHEEAHIQTTLSGKPFTNEDGITNLLLEMPYTGTSDNTNDAYNAIQMASTLAFRPGASRIFILFNADKQISHSYGPTLDETAYALKFEANATLFAFDRINFKNIGQAGKIIGQTMKGVYAGPKFKRHAVLSSEFPQGPFSSLVQETDGGLFTNKMKTKYTRALASGLWHAVDQALRSNSHLCKSCYLYWGNAGEGLPMCRTDHRMTC